MKKDNNKNHEKKNKEGIKYTKMNTKKIKTKNETFTMVSDLMIESTKLNSNEKLLLSYILRWQMANKQCRLSNKALGIKLGFSIDSIKRIITKL